MKRFIRECPFCKRRFTEKEVEDLFVDDRGQAHCPDCGTRELDDISVASVENIYNTVRNFDLSIMEVVDEDISKSVTLCLKKHLGAFACKELAKAINNLTKQEG